ncbi:TPA: restriction endonuclease subunit S [Klebsiella pneumoniae]|uniref:restriction endonuclease subunit S n=1 Tax=Klebsiella pneumoniae complex TaxID=3390273 RepID=UPI000E2A8417|nr:restriction endonuclease subunit S [Klebsiella pneumoniae]MBM0248452.1 restriction endonuclease subunit S [Klebsiella pneumoniae]MCS6663136.1 restriction endonuclease subunit S [Klebsiella pneumoniae subsp. pneumoniae]SXZ97409.1 type I restriction-modification system [Klebsiella pneumoniae]HBR2848797.1 restriction endonuclease subunit S [Klebsiella pneumoniae]HBR3017680.1 restriction endonuclease subunit S [Klebsiella pneumoniae]
MSKIILPEGWSNCTLADIAEVNPKKIEAEPDIIAGFVPMSHAPTNYNGKLEFEEKTWGEIGKSYTNFKNDDVIFAKVTPCFENGKAAIVKDMPNNIGAGSSEFYVLRARNQDIPTSYLLGIIKTRKFMQEGAENMTGAVGLRRVPRAFVESFPLMLPPLAEQKIIADKLDILLAQVDSTKVRLEKIPQILKHFRQAVLAEAVSGKLTEEWRGTAILNNWKSGVLKNFIKKPSYGTSAKSQKEGLIPVLRMGNLQNGELNWSDLVYTSDENEIEKYNLIAGDILFNRTNSPELVGKTSIYRGEKQAIYAGYLIKIQCLEELNPEYLNYHLNSHIAKQYCYEVKSDGVSQSNINAQKLAAYPLEVPPIKEQNEIVRRIKQLFAYADSIEKHLQDALECVNNLAQSILAKAFRGELTAQWRAENPDLISGENSAQALLVKIQQQRKNIKNIKRHKGKN